MCQFFNEFAKLQPFFCLWFYCKTQFSLIFKFWWDEIDQTVIHHKLCLSINSPNDNFIRVNFNDLNAISPFIIGHHWFAAPKVSNIIDACAIAQVYERTSLSKIYTLQLQPHCYVQCSSYVVLVKTKHETIERRFVDKTNPELVYLVIQNSAFETKPRFLYNQYIVLIVFVSCQLV